MFRFPLFVSLLVIFIGDASAQKLRFHLHDCALSDTELIHIQKMAEFQSDFYDEVFGAKRECKIHLHIYGDTSAFKWAQRRSMLHVISESGVYNPISGRIFMQYHDEIEHTAFHEMSHALFHHYQLFAATWIDEGLATYFKYVLWDSAFNVSIGRSRHRTERMKKYVADSSFTIKNVLNYGYVKFHKRDELYNYNISWGIVYFLRRNHDDIFRKILLRSKTTRQTCKAINREYPGGINQLEKDLIVFYNGY